MDIEALIAPRLRHMQPYAPIVPFEVLSRQLGRAPSDIVKLDANENPYGPPPGALRAIAGCGVYHIYPDPDQTALREAIAATLRVPAEHLLCGAGADEVIDVLSRAFVQEGDAVIDLPPTFGMYRFEADVVGARYLAVPRRADFSIDVEAVARCAADDGRVKLVYVASPNNPDGSLLDDAALERLLALPVVVVLDEAYVDFSAQPSRAGWVPGRDNLIVLRTFSKLAGLAGLRVGYGVFPLPAIRHLWKIKQPYTPNVAASAAAIAALADPRHLRDTVGRIVAERERLRDLLSRFEWLRVYPSQANFLLCRILGEDPKGLQVKTALQQRGILVRYFDKPGLRDCIRVSIGRPEHTDALVAALQDYQP
jgi:histidinol-phosphate aminotransferase